MRVMAGMVLLWAGAGMVLAEGPELTDTPTTQGGGSSSKPKNLDKALDEEVSVDFAGVRLEDAVGTLRQITQTNIAVNWPALGITGITKDTPVTLKLSGVTYEQALRALLEELPCTKSRANYLVGGNALEITTTGELGKLVVIRFADVSRILRASASGDATEKQIADHAEFLTKLVHGELVRFGEEADGEGRGVSIRDDRMIVKESQRGQLIARQTLQLFETPVRLGEHAPGTLLSVQEKKAQQAMNELIAKPGAMVTLAGLAADPLKKGAGLNLVILPGTKGELAKATPDLDYAVEPSGIVVIGPKSEVEARVTLAVYDLRDVIKHLALHGKSEVAADYAAAIFSQVKDKVPAGPEKGAAWGEFGKSPRFMVLYEYLLVVSGPASAQRAVAAELVDLHRQ